MKLDGSDERLRATHLDQGIEIRDEGSNERWYVVQTLARREFGASSQLRAQGFRTFLPRVVRTVRHARKLRTVTASAFPGYLFITLDLARDRWRAVNGTIGVSRLVTGLELPIPVPNGVVETIMSYVDEHGIAHFERDLTPGQTVRIKEGPLSQAVGKLIRSNGQTRARVLLEIMGAKVETSLPKSSLEAF